MNEKIKNSTKRLMAIILVVAVLVTYFVPVKNVKAELIEHGTGTECFSFDMDAMGFPVSSVTIDGYAWDRDNDHRYYSNENVHTIEILAGKLNDEYPWISTAGGLDDYKTYTAIENPNEDPNVEGDEYLLRLVFTNLPYEGQCNSTGISLAPGPFPVLPEIHAQADITISISGDELEYHYVADKPDEADVTYFKFAINSEISDDLVPFTFGNANYVYNNNEPPKNVSSVSTKQPIHYEYTYDGSGYVSFCVNGSGTDEYTKIQINGVDYSNQAPHTQTEVFERYGGGGSSLFCIENVPYDADNYDVTVEGRNVTEEKTVASFGWSYLTKDRSDISESEEGNFAHGRLEFVKAKYTDIDGNSYTFNSVNEFNAARFHGTGEIYQWRDGNKNYSEEDRRWAWGEARIPYGTELTVRVVPDKGYQLVSFSTSPNGFNATDEVGVYKIVLTKENFKYEEGGFDLSPVFAKIGSEVRADSVNVKAGTINTNQNVENGSLKLEVNDVVSMSPSRVEGFETTATDEGYEIENYLDISLYNSIYKGGKKDENNNYLSWDTEINNLDNNAQITLELENDMQGKEVALIHETHDGKYELVDVNYDSENNSITFETNSFSSYAVVAKDAPAIVDNTEELEVTFDLKGGDFDGPIGLYVKRGEKISKPADPTKDNYIFEGWYLDEEYHDEFDFNTQIEQNITLYAKWQEDNKNETYNVPDENGNEISFKEEKGHEYHLHITDYLAYTKEEVMAGTGISSKEYDAIFDGLKEATKEHGTLIGLFEIEVENEDHFLVHDGPFTIKIKMTPEMKKYNTFKMIFVEDDFTIKSKPVTFKVEGDYLVGTLDHLSAYAMTGSYVTSNVPKTGINVGGWWSILIMSIIGMSMGIVTISKRKSKIRQY